MLFWAPIKDETAWITITMTDGTESANEIEGMTITGETALGREAEARGTDTLLK